MIHIDEHYYYLLVNFCCISIPFIFSFHPKLNFYKKWPEFFVGTIVMMAIFIPWDMYFTKIGIWGFNNQYLSGIYLFNLPIEEWLFFICIPYACTFTYHCIQYFTQNVVLPSIFKNILWVIAAVCFAVAFLNFDKTYTFTTHLLTGLYLLYHLLIKKSPYLKKFMLTFLILLVPFIISNGVLTGVYFWEYPFILTDVNSITEKIVWYNNAENLQIRIFSMPIDDLSYGLTMLLLVTSVFEMVSSRRAKSVVL
ncbi:MAG TPA: lycopene cyclase domain-containing protein [Chitinophagales bacterium]|nr:lycopene cyclase domain-containing protein [Chitinophagales bacterium]